MTFFIPIIRGVILSYSSKSLKNDVSSVENDINLIISLILGLFLTRKIFIEHESGTFLEIYKEIPQVIIAYLDKNPKIIYLLALPILVALIFFTIKIVLHVLNILVIFPVLDLIERNLKNRSSATKRVMGGVFEIPRAVSYVILITILFNIIILTNINGTASKYISESNLYSYICREVLVPVANSKLAKQIPSIINNSFKIEIKNGNNKEVLNVENIEALRKSNTIIYYNGVTLDDGVKSNVEIDSFTKELVGGKKSDMEKAKAIYTWIGTNIEYDYNKADRILNNDFSEKSGAIYAFEQKTGICFDYSCLYVAMARATGLEVRLVTGEGFNGMSWVSHAWNEVKVDGKWVNVDTTFFKGGNYFNSKRFGVDHRNTSVAGQWP